MSYYNFPHTRDYDKDLGFLIERYNNLVNVYENVSSQIIDIVNKLFADGKITITTIYEEEQKNLKLEVASHG